MSNTLGESVERLRLADMLPRFTEQDADRAYDQWGCNCGPSALAVVAGLSLEEVRPHLGDFELKRYMNPSMMWNSLWRVLGPGGQVKLRTEGQGVLEWPQFGLVRIQWEGPWMGPKVPMRARYRYTHWVAACAYVAENVGIFDINCMNSGGWVDLQDWTQVIVPWILRRYPRADGNWHITHAIEVARAGNSSCASLAAG